MVYGLRPAIRRRAAAKEPRLSSRGDQAVKDRWFPDWLAAKEPRLSSRGDYFPEIEQEGENACRKGATA